MIHLGQRKKTPDNSRENLYNNKYAEINNQINSISREPYHLLIMGCIKSACARRPST